MPPSDADVRGPRYGVLGTWIHSTDPARTLETLRRWMRSGERHYVCLATVHAIMEARRDPALRAVYNGAGLTVPDGMPLVWVGRLMGRADIRRVYGPDLTLLLCAAAAAEGWSCYFYGGAPGVPENMAEVLGGRFPGLRVAGASSPPFRTLTESEQAAERRRIDEARPDIEFVGLGCLKQDHWMAAHRPHLAAPVLAGVGAAFDFHAGTVRKAPRWMMSAGLEWLFRLCQEPRRLLGARQLAAHRPTHRPESTCRRRSPRSVRRSPQEVRAGRIARKPTSSRWGNIMGRDANHPLLMKNTARSAARRA